MNYTIGVLGWIRKSSICDNYLLAKQTINNVIAAMRKDGLLEYDVDQSRGREKAFVLTAKGADYAAPFLESLNEVESRALELLSEKKLGTLTTLLLEYDVALTRALEEAR